MSNTVEWVATCGASANRDVLVVIDPISTGAVLASQAVERGLAIIAVWSESVPDELKGYVDKRLSLRYIGVVQHVEGKLEATARAVRAISGERLKGVLVGCETGVLLGDALAEELGQRGNGTKLSPLRRNKWLQTEAVRESGANACIQSLVTGTSQVERVLKGWPMTSGAFKAVVKPCEGAGSDGVTICNSKQDVRDAFLKLDGTRNVLGLTTYEVLVQEYLVGEEYVVDTVSRDGVHKCVAIWKYDKRIFNGSPVVYYGMRFLAIDDEPELQAMVDYTLGVLETLGIENGCMHSEIKLEPRGPVLIEVNCRVHGGEGTWAPMAESCCGYSAVSALLDAYFAPDAFAALPALPGATGLNAFAMEAKLRSQVEGTLDKIDQQKMGRIRALKSYQDEMIAVEVGRPISKTIDAVTACGNVNLVHEDARQLDADYATFHEIVESGLFRVKAVASTTAKPSNASLASYMAQSPPSSPQVQAFKSFTPSPPSTRFILNVNEPNGNGAIPHRARVSSSLKPERMSS